MKEFFSNKWKYDNIILYTAILISFSLIAYYILNSGYSMSSDSRRFARWADELIKLNFNFFEFYLIDKITIRPNLFFFSVPISLIALCKVIFVNEWQFAFLLLNLILVFFSLIIFVKSLLIINIRPILISLTLPIIVISVDILIWPRFILSDTIYSFLVIFSIYLIAKGIVKNRFNYFRILLIILLLIATRPSSISVVFAIIFFILILNVKILLKKRNVLLFLVTIFITSPFVLSLVYLFIEQNFNGIPKIDFMTNMVKDGMIIHDRPETWVDKPNYFVDVVYIYFLRIINFFNPYASTFSITHIILNTIQIFLIILSILIWSLFGDYFKTQDKMILFILLLSLSVAAFHSFILIDYDWRYRFPIILPMLMLLPTSLEIILKKNKLVF